MIYGRKKHEGPDMDGIGLLHERRLGVMHRVMHSSRRWVARWEYHGPNGVYELLE